MKVVEAHGDWLIVQIGESRHRLTIEQIAYIVRQAYWCLPDRSAAYLARIISDALIEPPVEAREGIQDARRFRLNELAKSCRKAIRKANPPVGREEKLPETVSEPQTEQAEHPQEWTGDESVMCAVCGTRAANKQCEGCKSFFCDSCFQTHIKDNADYLP